MEAKDLNKPTPEELDLNSVNQAENTPQAQEVPAESDQDTPDVQDLQNDQSQQDESTTINNNDETVNDVQPPAEDLETASNETPEPIFEKVDHILLSKEKLVRRLKSVLNDFPLDLIKDEVEQIKSAFYKKLNAELEDLKTKFIESGEIEENFAAPIDPLENELKQLLNEYKNRRAEFNRRLEEEKDRNWQAKLDVIEGIKDLINRQESLNDTFHEFRELQKSWREIGPIPQNKLRDMWETYNYHIENFYNYIKINKELRDLDLKKNLEIKEGLCERAEKLLLEPTIVKAFKTLQKLHDQWRETGPVPRELKEDLWNRFKETTNKINKKHQLYFEGLKDQLKKNLEAKSELCHKAEQLAAVTDLHTPKAWENKSKEIIELQQIWKTIGYAPKKDNNAIYDRFRLACDAFFNNKREFFKHYKKEQQTNLQLKTELCMQAEAMQTSTDWKRTTDEYIQIQKKWKQIGPVPRKNSDAIWKRFRTACDAFFHNKSNYFNHIDDEHDKNLKLKENLIEEIKQFNSEEPTEEGIAKLQDIQHHWNKIGHVPLADKDRVNQEFRSLINKHFDNLDLDEFNKNVQKFQNRLENMKDDQHSMDKLIVERNKIINKLKQLESDITTWENNIGFFAKSKKSDALVRDFNHKIENGRNNIKLLNKKLDMLDAMMK
jgi:hypothetical protein